MHFERISIKALVLWELMTACGVALLVLLVLYIFIPGTWLWYLLLWTIGGATVLFSFLYLPIAYLNIEYAIGRDAVVYRKGVIFPNTQVLYRDRIAFVTVYNNPLTPFLHISSLVISAAGGNVRILFMNSIRANEIATLLSKEKTKK